MQQTTGQRNRTVTKSFTLWLVPKRGDLRAQRAAEDFWAEKVKTARGKYDLAERHLRQVLASQRHSPLPEPQGSVLVEAARLHECAARNTYLRALKVFTELLTQGDALE